MSAIFISMSSQSYLDFKKLFGKKPSLCGNVKIDYTMVFGLEQEDGSFDYSHGAGTSSPSH